MHSGKQIKEHKAVQYVSTGCIVTGTKDGLLKSSPLGSCIAVIAYDISTKIGGLAHVMLPGESPKGDDNKYAENAITNLLDELINLGTSKANIEICLVGGANVLRKENDNIANSLIKSVSKILEKKMLNVISSSLGGFERRTATLSLSSGIVSFTVGDSVEKRLYRFFVKIIGE